jgi:hypothetical protein
MTRNLLLSALMLLAVTVVPSSAIPQTNAAPRAGVVGLPLDAASSSAIDDHRSRRRGPVPGPYGYPWS